MYVNGPIFALRRGQERCFFQPQGAEGEMVVWTLAGGVGSMRTMPRAEARDMWRTMMRCGWERSPDGWGTPPIPLATNRRGRR